MSDTEYKISIIMPNYNNAKYIAEAIESAMMQKGDFKWRLIVADNASTDNSAEIIKTYAEQYPDTITAIFRPSNIGWYPSLLDMFAHMNSEYYFVLCSDDFLTSDRKLADAVEFLDAHPDFTLYCSNWEYQVEGSGKGRDVVLRPKAMTQDYTFDDYINKRKINGNYAQPAQEVGMVCRNVLYSNGIPKELEYDECFSSDMFRWLATLAKGKGHFDNKSYGCYRITGKGVCTSLTPLERSMDAIYHNIKWGEYFKERNNGFFEYQAWRSVKTTLNELHKLMLEKDISFDEELIALISRVNSKRDIINRFIKNVYPEGLDEEKRKKPSWRKKCSFTIRKFLHRV